MCNAQRILSSFLLHIPLQLGAGVTSSPGLWFCGLHMFGRGVCAQTGPSFLVCWGTWARPNTLDLKASPAVPYYLHPPLLSARKPTAKGLSSSEKRCHISRVARSWTDRSACEHPSQSSSVLCLYSLSTSMGGALDSFLSYLRVPLIASSGIAALLSGVLYFKQK